jgi:hypothetical protein
MTNGREGEDRGLQDCRIAGLHDERRRANGKRLMMQGSRLKTKVKQLTKNKSSEKAPPLFKASSVTS